MVVTDAMRRKQLNGCRVMSARGKHEGWRGWREVLSVVVKVHVFRALLAGRGEQVLGRRESWVEGTGTRLMGEYPASGGRGNESEEEHVETGAAAVVGLSRGRRQRSIVYSECYKTIDITTFTVAAPSQQET